MRFAVVGAGVAGITTASFIARGGHEVTLFERRAAAPDARGGLLLQPCGIAVLECLGVLDEVLQRGSRVAQLVRQHASGAVTVNLSYEEFRPGSHALGIARSTLTDVLTRSAIASGVDIVFGCAVTAASETASAVTLEANHAATQGGFAAVVVADGMRSVLRTSLKLPHQVTACPWGALSITAPRPAALAGDVVLQRFRYGPDVIGLLPSGRDQEGRECVTWFQNMAVAEFDAPDRVSFARWRDLAISVSPESKELLMPLSSFDALQYSRYVTVSMPRWSTPRCVVIGDAAHALDPLLGMGANMALVDAATLAACVSEATEATLAAALRELQARRTSQLSSYKRAGAALTPLLLTDHALSRLWPDAAFRAALWAPAGRRRVMAAICGE
jgi:2-polyprenyl-6-methoxyphenol hydroxylase-like FAD-dependent oxidoreductase